MNQVYPIVLLIKFKSVKQIKEVKDSHRWSGLGGNPATGAGSSGVGLHAGMAGHGSDKISQKDAKTIFEHAQKLEAEYKHLISGTHIVQLRQNPYNIPFTAYIHIFVYIKSHFRYHSRWSKSNAYVCADRKQDSSRAK